MKKCERGSGRSDRQGGMKEGERESKWVGRKRGRSILLAAVGLQDMPIGQNARSGFPSHRQALACMLTLHCQGVLEVPDGNCVLSPACACFQVYSCGDGYDRSLAAQRNAIDMEFSFDVFWHTRISDPRWVAAAAAAAAAASAAG